MHCTIHLLQSQYTTTAKRTSYRNKIKEQNMDMDRELSPRNPRTDTNRGVGRSANTAALYTSITDEFESLNNQHSNPHTHLQLGGVIIYLFALLSLASINIIYGHLYHNTIQCNIITNTNNTLIVQHDTAIVDITTWLIVYGALLLLNIFGVIIHVMYVAQYHSCRVASMVLQIVNTVVVYVWYVIGCAVFFNNCTYVSGDGSGEIHGLMWVNISITFCITIITTIFETIKNVIELHM